MTLPTDFTILGTVLALAVAILLLSGLALYVAFRVRETLKDEKGGGARTAKVAFLIGLLFLSGGVFYFFASGFNGPGSTSTLGTTTGTASSATSSNAGSSSTSTSSSQASTSSSSTTSTVSTSSSSAPSGPVSMPSPTCPTRVTAGTSFTCTITIYNQGATSYSSASVVSSGDFAKFSILGCTESVNAGPQSSVPTTATSIAVGNLAPGTTQLTVTIQAPSQSGQYNNDVATLNAPGMPQPISVTFSIQVTA